jgi:hypothetical protein
MLTGALMRFSSNKYEDRNTSSNNGDGLMSEALSTERESLAGDAESEVVSYSGNMHLGLDDLSKIARSMLIDSNLDVSKVRPFFWTLVEAYVERFQVFPFDAGKALFSELELQQYPEQRLRDLVKQLEKLYKTHHGRPMRESEQRFATDDTRVQTLDDEISELRETLKYAAIAGERLDGKE